MSEYIIATIVGIIQIILSINLIIRQKKSIASVSEVFSSLVLFYYLNSISTETSTISLKLSVVAIVEYLCVKSFLVIFMIITRYTSFYAIKFLCRKKDRKLKLLKAFSRANYWPKLKLGLPEKANKTHPVTKVRFDGNGFPEFEVYYTVKLRKKYRRETRKRHFYMANKILRKDLESDKSFRKTFSKKQLNEIENLKTPTGYTWHHHQDAGVLQLVDEEIHAKTYHIGGYTIWGSK